MIQTVMIAAMLAGVSANKDIDVVVKTTPAQLVAWLQRNPDAIANATYCAVVSRKDGVTRVRKDSPKGIFEFSTTASVRQNTNGYTYDCKLIKVHQGGIKNYRLQARVTPYGQGMARVSANIYIEVEQPNVHYPGLRSSLDMSAAGFERLMQSLQEPG